MPAAPPLAFLPPRLDPRVLALSQRLLPLALRHGGAITARQVVGGDRLVAAMQAFQSPGLPLPVPLPPGQLLKSHTPASP